MSKQMHVTMEARMFEDEDDSLCAAAEHVRDALGLRGWQLDERWGDNRDTIIVTIPAPGSNDASGWDRLRALDCISAVEP